VRAETVHEGAHFRSGECRKGHHGDESYPASLPCGSVEQRYAGEQTSKKECINDALSDGVAWREVAAMKSPLFSEGLGVSDSTAGDSSPVEAGAPLSHAMQEPAVSIELSIGPGYLICLEDGKKFKCLQKHLRTHGLAPSITVAILYERASPELDGLVARGTMQ